MVEFVLDKPKFAGKESIILTEGEDDAVFIDHLLSALGASPQRVGVFFLRGKSVIIEYMPTFFRSPEFTKREIRKYAIMMDADTDHQRTLNGIHGVLNSHGEPSPDSGCVVTSFSTRISCGVFLFPGPERNGVLEDLCIAQLPDSDKKRRTIDFVENLIPAGERIRLGKRQVQAFLAVSEPDLCAGVGRGVRNGSFPIDLGSVSNVTDFLRFYT